MKLRSIVVLVSLCLLLASTKIGLAKTEDTSTPEIPDVVQVFHLDLINLTDLEGNIVYLRDYKYIRLQETFDSLNSSFSLLQEDYTELEGNYSQLNEGYASLEASYDEMESENTSINSELNNIRSLVYILTATTIALIATTVYFARVR